jgi:hypothetical protein
MAVTACPVAFPVPVSGFAAASPLLQEVAKISTATIANNPTSPVILFVIAILLLLFLNYFLDKNLIVPNGTQAHCLKAPEPRRVLW